MKQKIKLGGVNYLNALPLIYGIRNSALNQEIDLTLDYPAKVADQLRAGELDMGLVPVAVMASIQGSKVIGNYGIAADGKVASVCIFSDVPISSVKKLYLDYQSRTSVRLANILLTHHWKMDVTYLPAHADYIREIKGDTAGVIIGDRALQNLKNFPYVYDLATVWKEFSGLPFVFAAWIGTRDFSDDFIQAFNEANAAGMDYLEEIIANHPFPAYDLRKYYLEDVHYELDTSKRKGLALFLELLHETPLVI